MNKTIPLTTEQALEAIQQRRADALAWWRTIPYGKRNALTLKHLGYKAGITATAEQIENIWRAKMNQSQS